MTENVKHDIILPYYKNNLKHLIDNNIFPEHKSQVSDWSVLSSVLKQTNQINEIFKLEQRKVL